MRDDSPRWHPIMAAIERDPGVWTLVDTLDREYGRIEIRRTLDGIRYRTEAPVGTLIGWGTTLRQSCERVHDEYLRSHGPGPAPREMGCRWPGAD